MVQTHHCIECNLDSKKLFPQMEFENKNITGEKINLEVFSLNPEKVLNLILKTRR